MKLTKPFSDNSAVALLISSFVFIGACSGTDMKGNSEAAAKAKENKATAPIKSAGGADAETGKLECKPGEILKGTNADKTPICIPKIAEVQPGSGDTKENTGTEIKDTAETTSCNPGSADLTTFTSETSQETDLQIVSVLKPFETDKPIEVIVKKRTKPVIILLYSSNDGTKWNIKEEEGGNISKIYSNVTTDLNGIDFSKRNTFIRKQFSKAWQYPGTDSIELITVAQQATGLTVKKFQGCSISGKFIVN